MNPSGMDRSAYADFASFRDQLEQQIDAARARASAKGDLAHVTVDEAVHYLSEENMAYGLFVELHGLGDAFEQYWGRYLDQRRNTQKHEGT